MILERIDRSGHVIDIYTFKQSCVSIGRGYSNDLILNDVYTDPTHVKIEYDHSNECFLVSDLASLNGLQHLDSQSKATKLVNENGSTSVNVSGSTSVSIQSGDSILIGKTRLRILSENHDVLPAKALSGVDTVLSKIGTWWFFILCLSGLLGVTTYRAFLSNPFSETIYKDIAEGLYLLFAAAAYGGLWVIIARTQRRDGRFLMHANVLILAIIGVGLYFLIEPVLNFNFEWLMAKGYFSKFLVSVVALVTVYASCYQSLNMSAQKRLITSLWVPGFILLGTLIAELNKPEFQPRPAYNISIVSPKFQWRSEITTAEFLDKSSELYLSAEQE